MYLRKDRSVQNFILVNIKHILHDNLLSLLLFMLLNNVCVKAFVGSILCLDQWCRGYETAECYQSTWSEILVILNVYSTYAFLHCKTKLAWPFPPLPWLCLLWVDRCLNVGGDNHIKTHKLLCDAILFATQQQWTAETELGDINSNPAARPAKNLNSWFP